MKTIMMSVIAFAMIWTMSLTGAENTNNAPAQTNAVKTAEEKTAEEKTAEEKTAEVKTDAAKTAEAKTEPVKAAQPKNMKWVPFQLVFIPGFPSSAETSNVYGLKIGVPASGGKGCVQGFEASFLYSGTSYGNPESFVKGIQASWFGPTFAETVYGLQAAQSFAMAKRMYGMQAGPFIFLKDYSAGVQAAVSGVAMNGFDGFQAGASNVTVGAFNGCQFGASNVVVKGKAVGLQLGAFGYAEEITGCQLNLVNVVSKVCKAVQIGVVNYSTSKGFQFGGINVMKDGWLPVMVFFNFSF